MPWTAFTRTPPTTACGYITTGYTVNNPIGRAYYGLYNSISILVETRGIGAGSTNFARRVFSQENAAHSIIDFRRRQ